MRNRSWRVLAAAMMAVTAGFMVNQGAAQDASGTGILMTLDDAIGPATADFITRGIERAQRQNASVVVLRLDTPGGLDSSMRDIIKAILASDVPVATFVAPSGSRAASAGTYILYASHIAAMAPATNLGAATPVPIGGSPPDSGDEEPQGTPQTPAGKAKDKLSKGSDEGEATEAADEAPDAPDNASESKAVNDAVAYIRSLAEQRGRNADWAEKAVREAATLTANDALEKGVIDIVAKDVADLLRQMDGRTVELVSGEVTLATAGLALERIEPDWRTELLAIITNPSVAYFLLLIGIYGLLFEGYNPGALVPGVVGAICLLLALYALQVLPVNYAGLALIALGIILMISEVFVPSFGALGIGGLIAFIVGSVILMDTDVPGYSMPMALIISTGLVGGLAVMGIVWFAVRARRAPIVSGVEQLRGAKAVALESFQGKGHVRVHGENWEARSARPVAVGDQVTITAVEGLTLTVEPDSIQES